MYPEKPNLEYTNDLVMYILSKTRFSSGSIGWKRCADLSTKISAVKSTIIEGKVYCGGVTEEGGDTEYIIYRYALLHKWTTLPPASCQMVQSWTHQ